MLVAQSASEVDQQLNDSEASGLIKSIGIPSCPATLVQLQAEIDQDDPDFSRVARLVSSDVALTVAILRTHQPMGCRATVTPLTRPSTCWG
jgi:HD-like signal output (HDOD) protein